VRVESGGATAHTRVVVPTAQAVVRLTVDRTEASLGTPLGFDVYAVTLDGRPLANEPVTVDLIHGASSQQQQLALDAAGHARGTFASPDLGTNFLFASVERGGRAMDAAQVRIDPHGATPASDGADTNVRLAVDRGGYRSDEDVTVNASLAGSQGTAVITFESALGVWERVVRTSDGTATARLRATDATGEVRVGAAFVRDGAIEWTSMPLSLSGPGRAHAVALSLPSAEFAPGESAKLALNGGASGAGTYVVRISRGVPSGSALFASAPALIAVGVTTTQNSAPASLTWHPWVDSTGEHAPVLGFVRRTQPPPELSLSQAESEAVSWSVARAAGNALAVEMPSRSGRYDLSVLGISDDGSVSAGSCPVVVR